MANILDKIHGMDDNKLLSLFHNAQREKVKGNPDASAVLKEIQNEWCSRLERAKKGHYKATMPNIGMLATFGYCVGASGVKRSSRLELLHIIFDSDLPVVGSPAYTAEWGKKQSRHRYLKMHRTLTGLINTSRKDGSMDQAIDDWESDREYVDSVIKGMIKT